MSFSFPIDNAARVLQSGGVVAYPTEGVYGLGCIPSNEEAVGRTTLRWGEGLVGLVAENASPLNLTDASGHPSFAYRPETGEDPYQSLLGVPILRAGHTLGVLVIQNKVKRTYTDEEVELLQTIAMVLAEIVAVADLTEDREAEEAERMFSVLMGDNVEVRRSFIESHALEVKNLDV